MTTTTRWTRCFENTSPNPQVDDPYVIYWKVGQMIHESLSPGSWVLLHVCPIIIDKIVKGQLIAAILKDELTWMDLPISAKYCFLSVHLWLHNNLKPFRPRRLHFRFVLPPSWERWHSPYSSIPFLHLHLLLHHEKRFPGIHSSSFLRGQHSP